jgi:hypothetical protein
MHGNAAKYLGHGSIANSCIEGWFSTFGRDSSHRVRPIVAVGILSRIKATFLDPMTTPKVYYLQQAGA